MESRACVEVRRIFERKSFLCNNSGPRDMTGVKVLNILNKKKCSNHDIDRRLTHFGNFQIRRGQGKFTSLTIFKWRKNR